LRRIIISVGTALIFGLVLMGVAIAAAATPAPKAKLVAQVLVAGGTNSSNIKTADLYNDSTGEFALTKGDMNFAHDRATATKLLDGRVLIVLGSNLFGTSSFPAEIYDPLTETFNVTGSPINAFRVLHIAALLRSGKVLIAGGSDTSTGSSVPLASAEIYDPATGLFTATGNMEGAHHEAMAAALNDGRVLVLGGSDDTGVLKSAELYDPTAGTFGRTGDMITPRLAGTATLLTNGKVLVAGGSNIQNGAGIDVASSELYDPKTGHFTATGDMTVAREQHTATLLGNGMVLIAGGATVKAGVPATFPLIAELYNLKTGTFVATGSLSTARWLSAATLLENGDVLIAGGIDQNGVPISSAELYHLKNGTFASTGSMTIARFATATTAVRGR
jgi:hypothetical protein